MPTIQPSEARTVFAPVESERLNPLGNPKVPRHTRTRRSQRLLMIVTLIGRQSDLVAIELNHDRHLLEPSLLSRNHARRRHHQPRPQTAPGMISGSYRKKCLALRNYYPVLRNFISSVRQPLSSQLASYQDIRRGASQLGGTVTMGERQTLQRTVPR